MLFCVSSSSRYAFCFLLVSDGQKVRGFCFFRAMSEADVIVAQSMRVSPPDLPLSLSSILRHRSVSLPVSIVNCLSFILFKIDKKIASKIQFEKY